MCVFAIYIHLYLYHSYVCPPDAPMFFEYIYIIRMSAPLTLQCFSTKGHLPSARPCLLGHHLRCIERAKDQLALWLLLH